jgi:hypothetical protein
MDLALDLTVLFHVTKGETLVALIRVTAPALPPLFLVLIRVDLGPRIEQWTHTHDDSSSACERFQRAVFDFLPGVRPVEGPPTVRVPG